MPMNRLPLLVLLLLIMSKTVAQISPTNPADYATDWQRAETAMMAGLPQSALAIADQIYARAKANRNYPQLVKATLRRTVYRSFREDDAYPSVIRQLRADIVDAPEPARSVMQSVLGELYWHYFQQNRWKLMNRSRIETAADETDDTAADSVKNDPDDLRAWDAARLLTTATTAWDASVHDPALLQKTPLAAYDAVLMPGNADGRTLRPTLFDVLAHRALAFYQNTEADLLRPTFRFELDQPDYLAPPDVFAKISVPTRDTESLRARALRLYQQLIAVQLTNADHRPLADTDVLRLAFVHNYSTVPEKDALYRQTLTTLADRYQNQAGGDDYALALAQHLVTLAGQYKPLAKPDSLTPAGKWERKQAVELAQKTMTRWPASRAGRGAAALVAEQTKPTLTVQAEAINAPMLPFRVRIDYQNVKTAFVRVVRLRTGETLTMPNQGTKDTEKRRTAWLRRLLAQPEHDRRKFALPDDGDLHQHALELPVAALPAGRYALLVAPTETITTATDLLAITTLNVSRLGYLTGTEPTSGRDVPTLFVLDRQTGQPLPNVPVEFRYRPNYQGQAVEKISSLRSDAQGAVRVSSDTLSPMTAITYYFRLMAPGDTLNTETSYAYQNQGNTEPDEPTQEHQLLFTDRAIYRPGQPIYFKGVLYSGRKNEFVTLPNRSVEVFLFDANHEQVTNITLTTNEFGTFDGSFVAPVGRLTGRMTIGTSFGNGSEHEIRVEEYKRPTFAVTVDTVKTAVRLGQPVAVTVTARTFAGAVVDGAAVRYRVTRTYVQPWTWDGWYGVRRPRPEARPTEISSGTLTTDATGTTSLTFTADPDRANERTDASPFFTFDVVFDITDRAGETRSATASLRIGYTALVAELPIPPTLDKADPATFRVRAVNATGQVVGTSGRVTVWRLAAPTRPLRARLWEPTDRHVLTRTDYEKLFPNDLFADENEPTTWEKTTQVQQTTIGSGSVAVPNADLSARFTLNTAPLDPGEYRADLTLTDPVTGETAVQTRFFSLTDDARGVALPRVDTWFRAKQTTVELSSAHPTGEAVFLLGNTQPGHVLMSVERDRKLTQQTWLITDGTRQRVVVPVTEADRGGLVVFFTMVQNGRIYTEQVNVAVPFTNKNLTVETITLRDKLRPGQPEQWTLRVSGPDKDKVLAEMVATLYDASLDAFVPHTWPVSIYSDYYARFGGWNSQGFGRVDGRRPFFQYDPIPAVPGVMYPDLTWAPYSFRGMDERLFVRTPTRSTTDKLGRLTIRLVRRGNQLTGQISDEAGDGVPGVSVSLSGIGTVSNASGRFALTVPKKTSAVRVVFASIGYVRTEVTIRSGQQQTVHMSEDQQLLNEVVVVGYGTQNQKMATSDAVAPMASRARVAGELAELREGIAVDPKRTSDSEADNSPASNPGLPQPAGPRRNFAETAFFFPKLETDAEGRVLLRFTMPDALTRWRLLTFAHTKTMQTGSLERDVLTQKELMITANAPRFFREGDTVRLTARVNNLTDRPVEGVAGLTLLDALTGKPLGGQLGQMPGQRLLVAPGLSQPVAWTLAVPVGLETVTVRVSATAGEFTDAEERPVPVLPNRMLVLDSQPFWVNGDGRKTVRLQPLATLNPMAPVQHERLTVEVTSNPAWYALQALPYVLEYPFESTEQLASRLYANALAGFLIDSASAGSSPSFRTVLDAWAKQPPTTPLAKNPELKAVALTETPWLADARDQAAQQARLGQLFDQNRLANDSRLAIDKLKTRQLPNGSFGWFSGMPADPTITIHLLMTFGHLTKLGVTLPAGLPDLLQRATRFVDIEMVRWVQDEKKQKRPASGSYQAVQYLYARSFYPQWPIADKGVRAYLQKAVADHWLDQPLSGQAMAALTLARFGDLKTANAIVASLRERALVSDELGMYWAENKAGYRWYQAPIETQALLIEVFGEVANDRPAVDDLKRWLIRQKQTQAWPSTKATTNAVYALLRNGSDWLNTSVNTRVRIGSIDPATRADNAEIATGYQKTVFAPAEINPTLGTVQIERKGAGPAWGAVYWQHFEPLDKVMAGGPADGAGLLVQKTLFLQKDTPGGPILTAVTDKTTLKPGDLLRVRLVLKTDRLMDYVHFKDSRAAGFEPVAVLSGYKYQNGLGYYEAPRDTGTDFFLSEVPVGTHVFEYDLRVNLAGQFAAGAATVQCFYAPEFSAHSAGSRVRVGE